MLKAFMLANVTPLLENGDHRSLYIQDPLKAAVIMLHISKQYQIRFEQSELHRLCAALSLPKLGKDDFLQYWAEFSQHVSVFKT